MNLVTKNWYQNVMAALELVREAVQDADQQGQAGVNLARKA